MLGHSWRLASGHTGEYTEDAQRGTAAVQSSAVLDTESWLEHKQYNTCSLKNPQQDRDERVCSDILLSSVVNEQSDKEAGGRERRSSKRNQREKGTGAMSLE